MHAWGNCILSIMTIRKSHETYRAKDCVEVSKMGIGGENELTCPVKRRNQASKEGKRGMGERNELWYPTTSVFLNSVNSQFHNQPTVELIKINQFRKNYPPIIIPNRIIMDGYFFAPYGAYF